MAAEFYQRNVLIPSSGLKPSNQPANPVQKEIFGSTHSDISSNPERKIPTLSCLMIHLTKQNL